MNPPRSKSPRINMTIPWPRGRDAFHRMAEDLKAESAADLAREILTEIVLSHFGLEEAKRLGIISQIATSVPPPMYAQFAVCEYKKQQAKMDVERQPEINKTVDRNGAGKDKKFASFPG